MAIRLGAPLRPVGPKAKTKTGLGAALTLAEKDWAKIDFKKLVADTKILADKNTRQLETAKQQAQDYLHYIENFVGVPIVLVGVGPARDQVIEIDRSAPLRRAA